MKEIELIGKRKAREKHFLKQNGVIEAQVFDEDIHFLKNGIYEEIDNTLIDKGDCYTNKNNAYEVKLYKDTSDNLMEVSIDDNFIKTRILNPNLSELTENVMESKLHKNVCYPNILDNIDLEYNVLPTKVKEAIILKNKNVCVEKLVFSIETNMKLRLLENKKIIAEKDGNQMFEFDAPYMIDNEFKTNNNVFYELTKCDCDKYSLKIKIDEDWLKDENTKYPVMIDPTITNSGQNNSVNDTYIASGDEANEVYGNQDGLYVGVSPVAGNDKIYRALLKFDLPTIGTGSQIIEADLNLIGYQIDGYNFDTQLISIHRINTQWSENTANWNNMNDKFDSKIENIFYSARSCTDENGVITPVSCGTTITSLVKKWYTGTPNYGILLKANDEVKLDQAMTIFYSNNSHIGDAILKPILSISYRNQNGVEEYMDYQQQRFLCGDTYVNSYNGNLTTVFNLGKTIGSKMPVELCLVYNTNDVVLNKNIGYGLGCILNLHRTIKEVTIDGRTYLEYMDGDGTLHYFLNLKISLDDSGYNSVNTGNVYYDEDGLNLEITKNNDEYLMKDSSGNIMKFLKNGEIAYLKEIISVDGTKNSINYNSDNLISSIIDGDEDEIAITYGNESVTIKSPSETTILNYIDNKVKEINNILGTTSFEYNTKNIISKITDVNGMHIGYEYYEQKPYKVKKVSEYGINGDLGDFFELNYGFDTTTLSDSLGKSKTIMFNSQGGVVSTSSLNGSNDINNAYGISELNGTSISGENQGSNNKLLSREIPIKYVKNYLTNTSFENDDIIFNGTDGLVVNISEEEAETGIKSLKVINTKEDQALTKEIAVTKGKSYNFSAYIKTTSNIKMELSYTNSNNEVISSKSELICANNSFERYDVTIEYVDNAKTNLLIKLILDTPCVMYMDDVQLEEGKVANNYNLIENSDFSDGLKDWTLEAHEESTGNLISASEKISVVTLLNKINAVKMIRNPKYNLYMSREFNIRGKGGDVFNISFWYKNKGILSNLSEDYGSRVSISFDYNDKDNGHCDILSPELNTNDDNWQYVSNKFIAEKDYNKICLTFSSVYDANDLYITNMSLFKTIRDIWYEYDDNGNIIMSSNLANNISKFNYNKNNKLINMMNPKGKNFRFEYDNLFTDRVINGISDMGISNQIKYDGNKNPINTKIKKNNICGKLNSGLYRIRVKGTESYIKNISNKIKITQDAYNSDVWSFIKEGEYYKINHFIINNKFFTVKNDDLILSEYDEENSLFSLIENDNGSYSIKLKSSDKYLEIENNSLKIDTINNDNQKFQFYLETIDSKVFIENKSEYTKTGKFIKNTTDSLGNTTSYNINDLTGLTTSITDAKGNTTNYTYDDRKNVTSIKTESEMVKYSYNDKNLLEKMTFGLTKYNFQYDNFLNVKNIKVGDDITLVNNYYNSLGDLETIEYGNESKINYSYDEFYRLKKVEKEDDSYDYVYDNNGNLVKILSKDGVEKYTYDLSQKLSEYRFNDFKSSYVYDVNDNIIKFDYKLNSNAEEINNTYNDDDLITKTTFDDNKIDYYYDDLGRLEKSSINNKFNTVYNYLRRGLNTALMVNSVKNDNDTYSYKYNKLNNLTHVYYNNKLVKKYYYDDCNELIKEKDYTMNLYIKYKYNHGNLMSVKIYSLNDLSFIKEDVYFYDNIWNEKLTKFNSEDILYDEIGNPTKIGKNVTLNWINGRQLAKYNDTNIDINYKYNKDGLRIKKIVDGVETEYYLDDDDIIFEKTNNNVIYYIRNTMDDLIGFKYNNNLYFYLKNIQDDIVGILDSNCNIVAKYRYDSWGKMMSITDRDGKDISENNNHIANINPFRYRSYYYDKETGLYYLNKRYYNPNWKRFLNPDSYGGQIGGNILSHNVFAYSLNNPIMNYDEDGNFSLTLGFGAAKAISTLAKLGSIVGSVAGVTLGIAAVAVAAGGAIAAGKAVARAKNRAKKKSKKKTLSKSAVAAKTNVAIKKLSKSPNKPCAPAQKRIGTVVPSGEPFTISEAVDYVVSKKTNRDVVCINRSSAREVAIGTNSVGAYEDKPHNAAPGYFPHFHDSHDFRHAHIWYYLEY